VQVVHQAPNLAPHPLRALLHPRQQLLLRRQQVALVQAVHSSGAQRAAQQAHGHQA
jgi:hypothetical protein